MEAASCRIDSLIHVTESQNLPLAVKSNTKKYACGV